MNDNSALLDIKNLSVNYHTAHGTLHALREINFSIGRGKIVGVVGESGCGKSTLISAILGLMSNNSQIAQGEILFKQENLLQKSPDEWRDLRGDEISVVFQDPMQTLNPVLTIGRQMTDIQYRANRNTQQKQDKAIEMLEKVGISDSKLRLNQYSYEFSGGMRQRISIAMALMSEPSLLVADEPTTALDATLEVQVLDLLKDLQKQINCSVIFISHHLGAIAELCEEVVVMYAGEIVEYGNIKDIFLTPKHPYTKALIECDPGYIKEKTKYLPTIAGEVPQLFNIRKSCIFHERCTDKKSICETKKPQYHTLENGQSVKCHLYEGSEL